MTDQPREIKRYGGSVCWNWIGSLEKKGYGKYKGKYAHRVLYEMVHGKIKDGLVIDHLCRNKQCVNPAHLEAVSQRENVMRGEAITKENAMKLTCSRGHMLSGSNVKVVKRSDGVRRKCRACDREMKREKRYLINTNRKQIPTRRWEYTHETT